MSISHSDIIEQFKQAMLTADLEPPKHIIADGRLHRFKIDRKPAGAYKLYLDGRPAGYFQNWKTGLKVNWKLEGEIREFTPEEKRAYAIQKAEQELKRQAEETAKHQNAATEAARIWAAAKPAIEHPYLAKKRLNSAHGARIYNGALVLPLYAPNLRLMSLEFIQADGSKRFLKGGKKGGCFWWIGKQTDKVLLAEGYATAATLHECTGLQTFMAFDAGNLLSVAQIIRAKRQQAAIVICADHDASGVGQSAAEDAALVVGGLVAMPPEPGTDFNDLFVKGLHHQEGAQ